MTKHTNAPALRFPEFRDEWNQNKLSDVVNVYDGTHQTPKYTNEGIKFLSVENIKTLNSDKYISKEDFIKEFKIHPEYGDILMTRIGDIGTPNIVNLKEPLAYYVSLALLKPININSYFLNSLILSPTVQNELWRKTLHIAFPKKINKNEIAKVLINYPTFNEQEKIGYFFSKLDRQIELEEEKLELLEQQKRGYMQKIFSQELRFKDENGNAYPKWKEIKLKEILEVSKRKNTDNNYDHNDVLSVSREFGVINQIKYHGRSFAAKSVKNYKVVKPNSLIYTKSPLKGAPYGIFKVSFKNGIVSPLYAVYESNNKNITNFISRIFEFDNMVTYYLSKLVSKGAKNTINVTDEMAISGKISIPQDENEIQDIISFFDTFDELLIKQNEKINNLKQLKRGLLQKMFV